VVLDAIQNVAGFVSEPQPVIAFTNLTSSALELNISFWVDVTKTDPVTAKDMLLLKVKAAFQNAGIEIPHPVQAVYSTVKK
jgi:small-conductance mechanosensitive channel